MRKEPGRIDLLQEAQESAIHSREVSVIEVIAAAIAMKAAEVVVVVVVEVGIEVEEELVSAMLSNVVNATVEPLADSVTAVTVVVRMRTLVLTVAAVAPRGSVMPSNVVSVTVGHLVDLAMVEEVVGEAVGAGADPRVYVMLFKEVNVIVVTVADSVIVRVATEEEVAAEAEVAALVYASLFKRVNANEEKTAVFLTFLSNFFSDCKTYLHSREGRRKRMDFVIVFFFVWGWKAIQLDKLSVTMICFFFIIKKNEHG